MHKFSKGNDLKICHCSYGKVFKVFKYSVDDKNVVFERNRESHSISAAQYNLPEFPYNLRKYPFTKMSNGILLLSVRANVKTIRFPFGSLRVIAVVYTL